MKAVQIKSYGSVDVLEINNDAQQPTLKDGQVLVAVYAASINPFDWKVREGYMKDMMPLQFPTTLGGDFAGKVLEVAQGVSEFKMGDEIYGSALVFTGGSGAFAQFAAVNTKNSAVKPHTLDFVHVSALPLVGSSAVQALEDHIKLQSGQKILIHGGAGGIGHIAIQLAKALGAHVATTVRTEDVDFAKSLGADEVIDYKTQDFTTMLKDFDAVFDTVGGEVTDTSFQVLKKEGIIVSMLGQPNPELAKEHGVTAVGQGTDTNSDHLVRLGKYVESGAITVSVDKAFPIDQVKEAFAYQEKSHPKGKVVLKIKD